MSQEFYTSVVKWGKGMLVRGVENGKPVKYHVKEYHPTLFVPANKKTVYKSLDGRFLEPVCPGNIRDAEEFLEEYENVGGFEIHGQTRWINQFIGDYFSGELDWSMKKIKLASVDIECESEGGFPDAEAAAEKINVITIGFRGQYHVFCLGHFDAREHLAKHEIDINPDDVHVNQFDNEHDLLVSFIDKWREIDPDIVTGWNVTFFDVPYLVNRINRVLTWDHVMSLSPWANRVKGPLIQQKEKFDKGGGGRRTVFEIKGVAIIDYLELYKKFTYTSLESYKLDHVAHVELGMEKLDHSEHATMHRFYKDDFPKFVAYNVRDVEIVNKLEEKLGFIELLATMAYEAKVNFLDVYSQVRTWDSLIYHHLKDRGVQLPPNESHLKTKQYEGAYVHPPTVGRHEWVVSFDLASLYPHLIMQYNISPETLMNRARMDEDFKAVTENIPERNIVDDILNKKLDTSVLQGFNYTATANGQLFDKSRHGFLPEMMDKLYQDRKKFKKLKLQKEQELENTADPDKKAELQDLADRYDNIQQAKKIQLNSAYGACGNNYFRFYDVRLAEAITLSGQLSIKWIERKLDSYLNKMIGTEDKKYVIAGDTDSVYLTLGPVVEEMQKRRPMNDQQVCDAIDKLCKERLEPYINKCYQELADYTNAYEQRMEMDREVIAKAGVWTRKKRYVLSVLDNEGVRHSEPETKAVGIETRRSDVPQWCKDKLEEALGIILGGDEDTLLDFISEVKREFVKLSVEDIALPTGVNDIGKYIDRTDSRRIYVKGAPVRQKACIFYNRFLNQKSLQDRYEKIRDGEKIKYVYLHTPNVLGNDAIAFMNILPPEFDLHKEVDYDRMYERGFMKPLRTVLNVIGWRERKVTSIEDLSDLFD